jgi:hypothetical protein
MHTVNSRKTARRGEMTGYLGTHNIRITILVLYSDGSRQSLMRAKSAAPWNGPAKKKNGILGQHC